MRMGINSPHPPGAASLGGRTTSRGSPLLLLSAPQHAQHHVRELRRAAVSAAALGNGRSHSDSSNTNSVDLNDEDSIWRQLAFPSYMQSRAQHKPEVCRDFDRAVTAAERRALRAARGGGGPSDSSQEEVGEGDEAEVDDDLEPESVWHTIRREAERDAAAEPLLSSFLYASILAHDSFARALAFVLSNRLANAVMLPTQLFEIFHEVLVADPGVREGALADVEACRERDPACTSYSQALLYYKGYHALQTHRIAHALWCRGQKVMANALQSRMSEVLAVDIHPAARLGRGILLDHGTGVVIGETAIIGNNVSLLQNVTLGGTGKEHGDRHPKISDNVLIGACATVLGNITVGQGAQIAAGSLVLKAVAPHTMVAGSPAKVVGHVTGNPAEKMQQWSKKLLNWDPFDTATAEQPPQQQQQAQQQAPSQQPNKQQQEQAGPAAARAGAPPAPAAAAAGPAPPLALAPQQPLPKPTRLTMAAAEAAWEAASARMAGTSSSSLQPPAQQPEPSSSGRGGAARGSGSGSQGGPSLLQREGRFHVHSNGHSNGHSSGGGGPKPPPATASSPAAAGADAGAAAAGPSASKRPAAAAAAAATAAAAGGGVEEEAGGQGGTTASPAAPAAAARLRQAAAELRGVHEGEVDATIDESVAAEKWGVREEEPEYSI